MSERKKVYMYEYFNKKVGRFIRPFDSLTEAADYLKCERVNIRDVLNRRKGIMQKHGYHFTFTPPTTELKKKQEEELKKLPKILLLDIETAQCLAKVFSIGKQYVSPDQIVKDRFVLGVCAKWLYEPEMIVNFVKPKEAVERNDFRIMNKVHSLINQADIIIGHNLSHFDIPILNTRFMHHRLNPTHPFQIVDTCIIAKKQFGHVSNSLNYINKTNGLREKIDTGGRTLWDLCEAGNKDALKRMSEYCSVDVLALEDNYLMVRPYIKSHPNLGLYMETDETVCPNCGSSKIKKIKSEFYYTAAGRYSYFECKDCGCHGRYRQNDMASKDAKKKRKDLGISMAR